MIKLGDGWIAEGHRIYHKCGPGLRVELAEARADCDCGAQIPRRVRYFAGWLAGEGHQVLIASILDDLEGPAKLDPTDCDPVER